MFKGFFLRFFVFFFTFPLFAQEPVMVNIAVNELLGKGIDKSTVEICTDRLRNEMVNTGVFRVMERGEMQNILNKRVSGSSPEWCTS